MYVIASLSQSIDINAVLACALSTVLDYKSGVYFYASCNLFVSFLLSFHWVIY